MTRGVQRLGEQAVEFRAGEQSEAVQRGAQVGQLDERGLRRRRGDGVQVLRPGERRPHRIRALHDLVRGRGWRLDGDVDQLDLAQHRRVQQAGADLGLPGLGDVLPQHGLPKHSVEDRGRLGARVVLGPHVVHRGVREPLDVVDRGAVEGGVGGDRVRLRQRRVLHARVRHRVAVGAHGRVDHPRVPGRQLQAVEQGPAARQVLGPPFLRRRAGIGEDQHVPQQVVPDDTAAPVIQRAGIHAQHLRQVGVRVRAGADVRDRADRVVPGRQQAFDQLRERVASTVVRGAQSGRGGLGGQHRGQRRGRQDPVRRRADPHRGQRSARAHVVPGELPHRLPLRGGEHGVHHLVEEIADRGGPQCGDHVGAVPPARPVGVADVAERAGQQPQRRGQRRTVGGRIGGQVAGGFHRVADRLVRVRRAERRTTLSDVLFVGAPCGTRENPSV